MPRQPIFGPRGPANPGQLIVHPGAPVVQLTITLDNRYEPPQMAMNMSQEIPASIAMSCLLNAMQSLVAMQMQAEREMMEKAKSAGNAPPDLPPAPEVKPS